jgi:hypothetical protein
MVLELLSQLQGLNMAGVIKTPDGHSRVALYDHPNGTVTDTLLFTDPNLEDRLNALLQNTQKQ